MRGRNRGEMPTEIEKGTPSIREMAKESKESHTHSRSALGPPHRRLPETAFLEIARDRPTQEIGRRLTRG
jgi:hypothetical protein